MENQNLVTKRALKQSQSSFANKKKEDALNVFKKLQMPFVGYTIGTYV